MKSNVLLIPSLKRNHLSKAKVILLITTVLILSNCSMQSKIVRGIDRNQYDLVQDGLNGGESTNQLEDSSKLPLLHYAIQRNTDLEIIRALIQKGADVNSKANNGMTPLMFAVRSGRMDVVKLLIDSGALVDEQDSLGRTPLMHSADGDDTIHREIYYYLIRNRAKTGLRDIYGNTVGHYDRRRISRLKAAADTLRRMNNSYFNHYNNGMRRGNSYSSYGRSRSSGSRRR